MSDWNEYFRRVALWREAGDSERLQLVDLFDEGFHFRETDPEFQLHLLTQGRDKARQLNEPWWVLFFENWRLTILIFDVADFTRALPLAMELLVRFNGLEGRAHPSRIDTLKSVLAAYVFTDAIGFREELEKGFGHLDAQIDRGPSGDRLVVENLWTDYLIQTERWEDAFERATRSVALADQCGDAAIRCWHGTWAVYMLCEISAARDHLDQLAGFAADLAERSETTANAVRARAKARLWLAVIQRSKGNERAASRLLHRGMRDLKYLANRDDISATAIAKYYDIGGDFRAAVEVRNREFEFVSKRGMRHPACLVLIERCRLLSRAGALTSTDTERVRQAAAKQRVPEWYLERLARIEAK